MKQSEKLDRILRYLYERRNDNEEYSIAEILAGYEIESNTTEIARLAEYLEKSKYITLNDFSSNLKKARITAKGIAYAEGDLYGHRPNNIIHHYNIVNSPQANIVISSNQVTINQPQYDRAMQLIKQIREVISKDESLPVTNSTEIRECLTEIEACIENKKTLKFAINNLLGIGSDIASIAGLVLELAQVLPGIIPV